MEYEVIGYTATGMYSATVAASDSEQAALLGRREIEKLRPLSRVLRYRVFVYDDHCRQVDVTP